MGSTRSLMTDCSRALPTVVETHPLAPMAIMPTASAASEPTRRALMERFMLFVPRALDRRSAVGTSLTDLLLFSKFWEWAGRFGNRRLSPVQFGDRRRQWSLGVAVVGPGLGLPQQGRRGAQAVGLGVQAALHLAPGQREGDRRAGPRAGRERR